jgi:hypothetical protein
MFCRGNDVFSSTLVPPKYSVGSYEGSSHGSEAKIAGRFTGFDAHPSNIYCDIATSFLLILGDRSGRHSFGPPSRQSKKCIKKVGNVSALMVLW